MEERGGGEGERREDLFERDRGKRGC